MNCPWLCQILIFYSNCVKTFPFKKENIANIIRGPRLRLLPLLFFLLRDSPQPSPGWVVFNSFSSCALEKMHVCVLSHSVVSDSLRPMDCSPPGSSVHGDFPGKNTGVGSLSLLQGIFPTQGLNPGLPHCGWILYHLNHQGSLRILEWVP